jgi:hypothetical protein
MPNRLLAIALTALGTILPTSQALAWNKAGHMVSGAIAYDILKKESPELLFLQMERNWGNRNSVFCEAFDILNSAIDLEGRRSRVRIHPYATLFSGTARYLESGGTLTHTQEQTLGAHVQDAHEFFYYDAGLQAALARLEYYVR